MDTTSEPYKSGEHYDRPARCLKVLSWILLIVILSVCCFFLGDLAYGTFGKNGTAKAASINESKDASSIHYIMDHAYPKLSDSKRQKYMDSILKWSKKYDLCPVTVASIIWKESKFDEKCRYKGAIGPMQTIPRYHRQRMANAGIKDCDLNTIDKGVQIGCIVFKHYLDKSKGCTVSALKRYNGCVGAKNPKYVRDIIGMREKSKTRTKERRPS